MSDQQTNQSIGKTLLQWDFSEFVKHQRGRAWYIWTALIVIGLLTYSVFTNNFFLIMIVLIVTIVLFVNHKKDPLTINFQIKEDGVILENRFYPYREIKNFWLIYEPPTKSLYFDFTSNWRPRLSVPIINQDPLQIRKVLLKYLSEDLEQKEEPLSEALSRFLKL